MNRDTLDAIQALKASHKPIALLTLLSSGEQQVIHAGQELVAQQSFSLDTLARANEAIRLDKSVTFEAQEGRVFVHVINPPLRMIIVGAVHIAQALVPMAIAAEYAVTVVDPRRGFSSAQRFPGLDVIRDWPDDALEKLAPDSRTATITLTHDPKLDDPALHQALASPCFYNGSLGSRKTHAARLERLSHAGFSEEELARVHGPVGLPIGAQSPSEVAISIMAEVTLELRRDKALK